LGDSSIRCCGTLVAEEIAKKAAKKLDFGTEGIPTESLAWIQNLKKFIEHRDLDADLDYLDDDEDAHEKVVADATAMPTPVSPPRKKNLPTLANRDDEDSDDSLVGYDSPSSSRSASPTPSELEEIRKEPTLNIGVKKIPKPVYLAQLGHLVRSAGGLAKNDEDQEADRIEMALNCGEELIRRKRNYGRELGRIQGADFFERLC
jgi:telomere length regulation protein